LHALHGDGRLGMIVIVIDQEDEEIFFDRAYCGQL
jgi:hypothetical protein